ncbi:peptide deformylase [bacterium]|nr:peptide deformylase [bacterium]
MEIILPKQVGTKEGELLFEKSEDVESFQEGREIVTLLKKSLDYYGGVGLAAPQIGIQKRVFIVDIKETERYGEKYPQLKEIGFVAYINPIISDLSEEKNKGMEGCLSVIYGSLFGAVERSDSLKIEYFDEQGKKHTEEIRNPFHARVIQHEFDHLEGIIFLQRMNREDFSTLLWEEERDIRKQR